MHDARNGKDADMARAARIALIVACALASIGFTVALLIAEVTFGSDIEMLATSKFAIIFTNLVAITVSVLAISMRSVVIGRYKTE